MAIYFILGQYPTDECQIGIHHRVEDGYPLGADGKEIRENLSLRVFIQRITRNDHRTTEYEINRIDSLLRKNQRMKLDNLSKKYDHQYSTLIRQKRIVLAQHKIADERFYGVKGMNPDWNPEQITKYWEQTGMILTTETQSRPATMQDSYKAIDNDIYYLLSTPS
jgi:hypothetical protein